MRHIVVRALLGAMLVTWCQSRVTADSASVWQPYEWPQHAATPYATSDGSSVSEPPVEHTAGYGGEENPDQRWMFSSATTKVSWPRLRTPELGTPRLPRPQFIQRNPLNEPPRNAWAHPQPAPSDQSPLAPLANGARRVGDGARTAWHKTVDVFTPGERSGTAARVAERPAQPSLWQRMFGSTEPERNAPQTIPEWIAQDRVDK